MLDIILRIKNYNLLKRNAAAAGHPLFFVIGEFALHKGAGLVEQRLARAISGFAQIDQMLGNLESVAGQLGY